MSTMDLLTARRSLVLEQKIVARLISGYAFLSLAVTFVIGFMGIFNRTSAIGFYLSLLYSIIGIFLADCW